MIDYGCCASLFDAYRPALIRLGDNLIAAAFPLMKIYPAYHCLQKAITEGRVAPDSLIVESSSGTMALGLAIVCQWTGHRLTIVSDYACDPLVQMRLRDLGATVEVVAAPAPVGGYQRARLDRLDALRRDAGNSFWVNQYDNIGNAESYGRFAAQLVEALGRVDCLVGTVGSGGSVCGTAKYLRLLFPDLIVVGVDTFGSVLFGQPDAPRALRGLGNSILPLNLDHSAFNEIHWVSAAEAFTATRSLHRKSGLFRGGTSGACWHIARYWAERHRNLRTVCMFPDDGHRYLDNIYNDTYMRNNKYWLDSLPAEPRNVQSPAAAGPHWSYMAWEKRTYEAVIGRGNGMSLAGGVRRAD
jgi:S-sulfo-L-cysteine synthase (3-phospho-L-serine-dependent)